MREGFSKEASGWLQKWRPIKLPVYFVQYRFSGCSAQLRQNKAVPKLQSSEKRELHLGKCPVRWAIGKPEGNFLN